ncbi:MAG: LapA family protein [Microcoleus sp.]
MKTIPLLGISFLVAITASAIGVLSVQNATLVALNLLFLKSIKIPIGVVLALSFSIGAIAGALLLPLWSMSEEPKVSRRPQFRDDRVDSDRTEPLEEI